MDGRGRSKFIAALYYHKLSDYSGLERRPYADYSVYIIAIVILVRPRPPERDLKMNGG